MTTSGLPLVERVARITLAVTTEPWPFAAAHGDAIACHWQQRKAENPAFFNGRILVMRALSRTDVGYAGRLSLEQFADFLYWRDSRVDTGGTLDAFGSALLRSSEGYILLARHAADTLNAGRICLPGGFLDARDMRPDGSIDLDAAIARELEEETGLSLAGFERVPGYIVTRQDRYCSLAIEHRSRLPAMELQRAIHDGLARSGQPELTDTIVARQPTDLDGLPVLDHARAVVTAILAGTV
ncbi:MAG: NUDIX hydrolase [Hyphomicrobiaceae bacterium]|nr:NUDIX hydrolase [Hyphomicrobiaceae bacterium]